MKTHSYIIIWNMKNAGGLRDSDSNDASGGEGDWGLLDEWSSVHTNSIKVQRNRHCAKDINCMY